MLPYYVVAKYLILEWMEGGGGQPVPLYWVPLAHTLTASGLLATQLLMVLTSAAWNHVISIS